MRNVIIQSRIALPLIGMLILGGCFKPKAGVTSAASFGNKIVEEGLDTKLSIGEGSLAGTEIDIGAGSLQIGTSVALEAVDSPSLFTSIKNVSSASSALSVTAADTNGNIVSELESPMTLRIPIVVPEEGAGLVEVEKTEENLCVFLDADDENFYVFRPGSFQISENFAIIESTRFGIYQAFFCGDEFIDEGLNAAEEGIAGRFNTGDDGGGGGGGDSTAPAVPTMVEDDSRHGDNDTTPTISWGAVADEDLDYYEVAVGTVAGQSNKIAWTNVGNVTSYSFASGAGLESGKMYYASVRAVDKTGNKSSKAEADGWQQLECPSHYEKIHGNETSGLGGTVYTNGTKTLYDWTNTQVLKTRDISDFCIMKYEARDNSSAVSADPAHGLYLNLNRASASAQCETSTDHYLTQNNFWQAVARLAENNTDNFLLENDSDSATNQIFHGQIGGSNACSNTDPLVDTSCVSTAASPEKTRELKLYDSVTIFDFAGNMEEWIRDDGITILGNSSVYTVTDPTEKLNYGPEGDYSGYVNWATNKGGLGTLTQAAQTGMVRGGGFTTASGIFEAKNINTSTTGNYIGFRCIYAP